MDSRPQPGQELRVGVAGMSEHVQVCASMSYLWWSEGNPGGQRSICRNGFCPAVWVLRMGFSAAGLVAGASPAEPSHLLSTISFESPAELELTD